MGIITCDLSRFASVNVLNENGCRLIPVIGAHTG